MRFALCCAVNQPAFQHLLFRQPKKNGDKTILTIYSFRGVYGLTFLFNSSVFCPLHLTMLKFFFLALCDFSQMHFDCMHFAITALVHCVFISRFAVQKCKCKCHRHQPVKKRLRMDHPKYCNIQIMMRSAKLIKILSPPVVRRAPSNLFQLRTEKKLAEYYSNEFG